MVLGTPDSPFSETAAAFKAALKDLDETQASLADRLSRLGDDRSESTILRSVQRMASGEIRTSGEMKVILELLRREREIGLKEWDRRVAWTTDEGGKVRTQEGDFRITLSPERGKWRVSVIHRGGYSHAWPRFSSSLEEAKTKAYGCHRNAIEEMERIRREAA